MENRHAFIKKIMTLVKFGLLLILIIGIPAYIFFFHRDFIAGFDSLDEVNAFLAQYKAASVLIYLGCQIIQIVICIIPGQALQFASGYLYDFWLGYLFSLAGVALGTIVTFYLARILGKDAMYLFFGQERFDHFVEKLNSKRAFIAIFLIYLIPGIPKDLFSYAAGVSKMKLLPFVVLSLIGRSPAMMGSIMIGSMTRSGSYIGVIIISVLAIVLCILGLIFHKRITGLVDKGYQKFTNS